MKIIYNETITPTLSPTINETEILLSTKNDNRNIIWISFQITFLSIFMFFLMTLITYITHQLNISREMRRLRERASSNIRI